MKVKDKDNAGSLQACIGNYLDVGDPEIAVHVRLPKNQLIKLHLTPDISTPSESVSCPSSLVPKIEIDLFRRPLIGLATFSVDLKNFIQI